MALPGPGWKCGVVALGLVAQDGGVALVRARSGRWQSRSSFIRSKFHDAEPSVP